MNINHANLSTIYTGFKAAFQGAFQAAPTYWNKVATAVTSSTSTEEYGWLGSFPSMREWLGDRVVNGLRSHGYSIRNKDFELTVGVPRTAIEDDQFGVYRPMMEELGRSARVHPDELIFSLLAAGPSTLCYDGQFFFDTDHPVLDAAGVAQSQANWDNNSGSGTPWFLLDCSRAIKPLILQTRKADNFIALNREEDQNVFMRKEFLYGVDARRNAGFSLWQLAYGSRKTLDETNLQAAWTAMTSRRGDFNKVLAIKPTVLVVPESLHWAAKKLIAAAEIGGTTNVMKDAVEVISVPYL